MEHMAIYWTIVAYSYIIAEMIVMGCILYCFAKPFMENKKGAIFVGIAYFVTMLILYFMPVKINNFVAYSIGIFLAFIVMCRTDRRNYRQKIFIALTFFSLRWLSGYMTSIILNIIYQRVIDNAYMISHPYIQLITYIVVEILYVVTDFVFIGISVRYITKTYVYKNENMSVKEMFMLIVPSITGMTGYGIMQYFQTCFDINTAKDVSGLYNGLAFLHYGISIITIIVVTVLFQNIKARQEEKLQNELLAVQVDSIRQHIEQVEGLYNNIRSIKHDMTNHILTLERLYTTNKTEEASVYGTELKNMLVGITGEIKSGNPVTDVILQEVKKQAEKREIQFHSDFYYPPESNVNAFDVSVILNNALQNALENTEKKGMPYISILSYRRNNAYMIEISNSFTGDLQWDTEKELPVTSKRNMDGHGYGLANIRRVARKYSGDIDIVLKDGEFCLYIMLIIG